MAAHQDAGILDYSVGTWTTRPPSHRWGTGAAAAPCPGSPAASGNLGVKLLSARQLGVATQERLYIPMFKKKNTVLTPKNIYAG